MKLQDIAAVVPAAGKGASAGCSFVWIPGKADSLGKG